MTHKYFKPKDYDIFIGIDVDKNSFSFTVKDHSTMKKSKKVLLIPSLSITISSLYSQSNAIPL